MIPMNRNWLRAQTILSALVKLGCEFVVISPGSRNTPLSHCAIHTSGLQSIVEVDERNAAFLAVGMGKSSRKPAILICTSGTAVANYLPGIVEAYYSRTPLIVLTADRPESMQQCGSPQTIQQTGIFGSYVSLETSLPEISDQQSVTEIIDLAIRSYSSAMGLNRAPVHINCPFEEPLQPIGIESEQIVNLWHQAEKAILNLAPVQLIAEKIDESAIDQLLHALTSAEKPVIVAGPDACETDIDGTLINSLAEKFDAPILADIVSGLRGKPKSLKYPVLAIRAASETLHSDCILWFGNYPTSNPMFHWMASQKCPCFRIQSHSQTIDPDRIVTLTIHRPIGSVIDELIGRTQQEYKHDATREWERIDAIQEDIVYRESIDENIPLEAFIAPTMIDYATRDSNCFLSNSMSIRYADWFSQGNPITHFFANKGANGIDGILSTATGIAIASDMPTYIVIGDLAFFHNLNALELISRLKLPITILLSHNGGGGIFHYLPARKSLKTSDIESSTDVDSFETIQGIQQQIDFKHVCHGLGVYFYRIKSYTNLMEVLDDLVEIPFPRVFEIYSDRSETESEVTAFLQKLRKTVNR